MAQELILGVALCLLLAGVADYVNHYTEIGKQFETFTYNVLQGRLKAQSASVTVVDISDLRTVADGVTPRDKLQEILEALGDLHPRAIAIDIDFSPNVEQGIPTTFVDPKKDPGFFRFCLQLRQSKNIPVFLGISRTELLPPAVWLKDPKYQPLAAAMWLPKNDRGAPEYFAPDSNQDDKTWDWEEARTLSSALAASNQSNETNGQDKTKKPAFLVRLFAPAVRFLFDRTQRQHLMPGVDFHEPLIDFGLWHDKGRLPIVPLRTFDLARKERIESVFQARPELIEDKMILIGDVSEAADKFANPVNPQEPVPGVIVQALAANTMSGDPLFQFADGVDFWLDVCLGFTIFVAVFMLPRVLGIEVNEAQLFTLFVTVAAVAVVLVALSIDVTRLLWNDFLFVILGLAIHPISHRTIEACKNWLEHYLGLGREK